MRAIRSVALSGCVLLALAFVIVGAASATGPPDEPAAGADTAKARHAAELACKAKGPKPGTDAFKKCVKTRLGGGPDASRPAKPAPTPAVDKARAAAQACQAQGLQPDTDAFKQCVKGRLGGDTDGSGSAKPAPNPVADKARAAAQACQAQGLQPDTDAFKQCVQGKLGGGTDAPRPVAPAPKPTPPAPNPAVDKARAAAQACQAQGLQPGTDAFKQCVRKALG